MEYPFNFSWTKWKIHSKFYQITQKKWRILWYRTKSTICLEKLGAWSCGSCQASITYHCLWRTETQILFGHLSSLDVLVWLFSSPKDHLTASSSFFCCQSMSNDEQRKVNKKRSLKLTEWNRINMVSVGRVILME